MTPIDPEPEPVSPSVELHRLMTGHRIAQAIHVAAKLGVADHLADGPRHSDELARSVGAHAGALHRLLRALASVGVFTEVEPKRFALTPVGVFLQTACPGSLRALALMINELDWEAWGQALHSVLTGETAFDRVHGMHPFEYFRRHPGIGRAFDEAMTGFVTENGLAAAAAYDFTPFAKIVDVGGGHGALMIEILKAAPAAKGLIFDLPDVVEGAKKKLDSAGLYSRCECVGGDFFDSVPAGGDAYILSSVIHDWNDDRCLAHLPQFEI